MKLYHVNMTTCKYGTNISLLHDIISKTLKNLKNGKP